MARLLLGPLLRHVGERHATIWVETSERCEVEVRAGSRAGRAKTFTVAGHHYAIVIVEGLEPASSEPYEVRVDGETVWPEPGSPFPPSRIRTVDPSKPIRLLIGSCREPPNVGPTRRVLDPDIFDAYANRMAAAPLGDWPELLLLIGDQVYADETSSDIQDFIRSRRDIDRPPGKEVADFEEYTRLYYETWGTPVARWFLSTMPTAMIFDDHDVRDDWNTSQAWRRDMARKPWWKERLTGALVSYWIYQHLGNLSPAELTSDPILARVTAAEDGAEVLRDFAEAADREVDGAKGTRWSYRRDLGPVRVLVADSRCGRILAEGRRSMLSDREFEWLEQQTEDGRFEHLVLATSMPWLLPRALHDLESSNEALCAGSRGRSVARLSEKVRRGVDLEHWAAFRKSFDRLAAWFGRIGRPDLGGSAPATITVVSGDVHHTYLSEAEYPEPMATRVHQLTCSPIHNTIPLPMRVVFRLGWSRKLERLLARVARWARVPPVPIRWHHPTGPHFGNMLALLELDGREARIRIERAVWDEKARGAATRRAGGRGNSPEGPQPRIDVTVELSLTDPTLSA